MKKVHSTSLTTDTERQGKKMVWDAGGGDRKKLHPASNNHAKKKKKRTKNEIQETLQDICSHAAARILPNTTPRS
jgi:hypothetical protein